MMGAMSDFPIHYLDLPGLPSERLFLSPSAWDLLCRFKDMPSETDELFKVPPHLRTLREKAGLSRNGVVAKAASLGLSCTFEQVRHWEEGKPVMEKLAILAAVLEIPILSIIAGAMEWDHSLEDIAEVSNVFRAFHDRIAPEPHKDLRQLKSKNKKVEAPLDAAIERMRQRLKPA